MKKATALPLVIGLLIGVAVGFGLHKQFATGMTMDMPPDEKITDAGSADDVLFWTCAMHPEIRMSEPGTCPKCPMKLIAIKKAADDPLLGARELRLSENARQLAQIQVMPVERRAVTYDLQMVGTVEFDETRLATITAWVGGRLDRLYVDYTGVVVREGDHMVYLYSPEVFTAQEELLQAKKSVAEITDTTSRLLRESYEATLVTAREKLRLWGLSAEQIAAIEARGKAEDHITVNAPIGGVVVQRNADEGMYVKTGTPIYRIADLSQVWVKLDAYEHDLAWLRYGQQMSFSVEAYPGEQFHGRIAFIDPVLTRKTRTVKVRINVPNPDGRLKPGMFVRAAVHAQLGSGGHVIDSALANKWVGPMHPEIVKDGPGKCDICGMALMKAVDLGFVSENEEDAVMPLVIPASAPLITGKRAVVYVQNPEDPSRFAGRVIVLGPRAGDEYIVRSGLEVGEKVVVNGAFKIDSALQIRAKTSMMSRDIGTKDSNDEGREHKDHDHE